MLVRRPPLRTDSTSRRRAPNLVVRVAIVALAAQIEIGTHAACTPSGAAVEAHEAEAFEYERPFSEVWPELVQLAKEQSFDIADVAVPPENRTVESKRRPDAIDRTCSEALTVRHTRIDAKRYTLHTWLESFCADGDRTVHRSHIRAWDTEWELIQRVEPVRASAIRQRAQRTQSERDRQQASCARGCAAGCAACETCAAIIDRPPSK